MADDLQWFYARDNHKFGPMPADELRRLISSGQVADGDLVWNPSMPQWAAAATLAGLFPTAGVSTSPDAIEYFRAAAGMPQRAMHTLRNHSRPLGDTNDWPLDDLHVAHFKDTIMLRKRVVSAANLYRALMALSLLAGVVMAISAGFMFSGPPSSRAAALPMLVFAGVMLGFGALYYITYRATLRSKSWATMTMTIIFVIGIVFDMLSLAITRASAANPAPAIGVIVGILFGVAFAISSWRSYIAIPKYLAQPAWCQELIVTAGL